MGEDEQNRQVRTFQLPTQEEVDEIVKQANTPLKLMPPSGLWASARHARNLVAHYARVPLSEAERILCRRGAHWVALKAHTFSRREDPYEGIPRSEYFREKANPSLSHFDAAILPDDWAEVRLLFDAISAGEPFDGESGIYHADWCSGDFRVAIERDFSIVTLEVVGLCFDETALLASIGVANGAEVFRQMEGLELEIPPEPKSTPRTTAAIGGRPRAGWWEDAIADIAAMLYNGDLKPDRQRDIELALSDWMMANGRAASESSIASRAQDFSGHSSRGWRTSITRFLRVFEVIVRRVGIVHLDVPASAGIRQRFVWSDTDGSAFGFGE